MLTVMVSNWLAAITARSRAPTPENGKFEILRRNIVKINRPRLLRVPSPLTSASTQIINIIRRSRQHLKFGSAKLSTWISHKTCQYLLSHAQTLKWIHETVTCFLFERFYCSKYSSSQYSYTFWFKKNWCACTIKLGIMTCLNRFKNAMLLSSSLMTTRFSNLDINM